MQPPTTRRRRDARREEDCPLAAIERELVAGERQRGLQHAAAERTLPAHSPSVACAVHSTRSVESHTASDGWNQRRYAVGWPPQASQVESQRHCDVPARRDDVAVHLKESEADEAIDSSKKELEPPHPADQQGPTLLCHIRETRTATKSIASSAFHLKRRQMRSSSLEERALVVRAFTFGTQQWIHQPSSARC